MYDVRKAWHLIDKWVQVICTDGDIIEGYWMNHTSAVDNEPDGESITIRDATNTLIEIFTDEIKEIQEVKFGHI